MAAFAMAVMVPAGAAGRAPEKSSPSLEVRIDDMAPGAVKSFQWKGRPFMVVRTTSAMLDDLRAQTPYTWSERPIPDDGPAFFVFSATSPAPACPLVHAPQGAPRYAPERLWQGGLYDPCHFGEWDYAGRAIRQYLDQDEAMRRADLQVPAFELKGRTLRMAR